MTTTAGNPPAVFFSAPSTGRSYWPVTLLVVDDEVGICEVLADYFRIQALERQG